MDYILEEMKQKEADGVDFFMMDKMLISKTSIPVPLASYTREQCLQRNGIYPRLPRKFWKMIDGKKTYISQQD